MFEEYGSRRSGFKERGRKILLFLVAILAFLSGLYVIIFFGQLPTSRQKQVLQERERKEKMLLESLEMDVLDAGFLVRNTGDRQIYVPAVAIRVSNISDVAFSQLTFKIRFRRGRQSICSAHRRSADPRLVDPIRGCPVA